MLKPFLDQLHDRFNEAGYLSSDPLEFVHRYSDPWDQEAVALVAALLAYGNVKQIRRSVSDLLLRMGPSPAAYVRAGQHRNLDTFVHRFNTGRDLAVLFKLLARSWKNHGSLGAHFLSFHDPAARDFGPALDRLIDDFRQWAGPAAETSFAYLLTAPRDGSCCKRWCMFLRWMGRKDSLDPGLWTAGSPLASTFPPGRALRADQLVIPLDTHTGRISQYLGLTRRKSVNWLAAVEATESLRACDAADPVRYDFALARLGILDLCQRKFKREVCSRCELLSVCKFARRRRVEPEARP